MTGIPTGYSYIHAMKIQVVKTQLDEIRIFRTLFLHESNFQFIHNKCHDYGWADTYLFVVDEMKVGYGSVWGKDRREDRDAIFEFYIISPFKKCSNLIFPRFVTASGVSFMECQTNDRLLSSMMFEYAHNIQAEAVLFEDHYQSSLHVPGTVFRKAKPEDGISDNSIQYVLEKESVVAATGGFLTNYNMPYADIFMEVKENFRRKELGSLIVQELKKEIYLTGRVPAARCNINNKASKATLLKAGFRVCGFLLNGEIKKL